MKLSNIKVTVTNTDGEIIDSEETGRMYDANIKACFIRDSLIKKYPDHTVKSEVV